ncbi:MAG: hypothetical protein ACFFCP_16140 [Promethearchaeota archaeon]
MESLPNHGLSLVWGSLRNLFDLSNVTIPEEIRLVDTIPGHFPIDSFNPVPLELPRGGSRIDLSGRFNSLSSELWKDLCGRNPLRARIVQLPHYTYSSNMSYIEARKTFSAMLKTWNKTLIPESVPCAALAIRMRGGYSEVREAEFVFVLLIWPNMIARTLQLDWYEGPLEDCISPEWYVKSSLALPLQVAFNQTRNFVMYLPNWNNLRMSLSPKPAFLGFRLQNGNRKREVVGGWLCEWEYDSRQEFLEDSNQLVRDMEGLFLSEKTRDANGAEICESKDK